MSSWLVFCENTDHELAGTWDMVKIQAKTPREALQKATVSSMGYGAGDGKAIVCSTDCANVFELEHPRDLVVGAEIGLANLDPKD